MRRLRILIAILAAIGGISVLVVFTSPEPERPRQTNSVELLAKQAKSALGREDIVTARRLYDLILELSPEHAEALLIRGQIARDEGDRATAKKLWNRVPDRDDLPLGRVARRQGGTARYLEGTLLLEDNDAQSGEAKMLRSIELNPTYLQPRDRLVELYVAQMRTNDVRRQLQGIRRLRRWTIDELALHELIADGVTNYDKGSQQMADFVAANPNDLASHFALARYYMLNSRHEAAEQLLRSLSKRRDRDADVAGLYAETLMNLLRLDEADQVIGSSQLKTASAGEHYWRGLGRLRMEQGDWSAASDAFEQLCSLFPNDLAAQNQYGDALRRAGRHQQAETQHARAKSIDQMRRQADRIPHGDKSPDLLLPIVQAVARLMSEMERFEEAVWWFEMARELAPNPLTAKEHEEAIAVLRSKGPGLTTPSLVAEDAKRSAAIVAGPAIGPQIGPVSGDPPKDKPAARATQVRLEPPAPSTIRLRDVHADAGLKFSYYNGQTGLKYLVESMGGGVAILDYDLDGHPDIYLTQGCALPTDDSNTEHRDRLYRNLGDGSFEDVTRHAGLGDHRYGQGCASGDFDNDGDPDLFVANFGRNAFYRNNGDGTFDDITESIGLADDKWSAGAAFADFDRDGYLDLYIANYVDSLRVCHADDGRVATCDPHNFGGEQDRIFWNRGDGTWRDITKSSGIMAKDGKGLGVLVADFDRDGWQDVYVANDGEPNFFFRNLGRNGEPRFERKGRYSGASVSGRGEAEAGMGLACADFNYDGQLDIYVTNFHRESNTMYLNLGDFLFRDATQSVGLSDPTLPFLGFGVQPVDLDLDGRWELFVANGHIDDLRTRGDPWKMTAQLFRESGGGRFQEITKSSGGYFQLKRLGRGVVRWDFDRDNLPDLLVVNQNDNLALLRNETKSPGRALVLELCGRESNRDAVGAFVEVETESGSRVYVMSAGDGFFSHNERRMLIGLGDALKCPPIKVIWPSGLVSKHGDLPIDELVRLVEPETSVE